MDHGVDVDDDEFWRASESADDATASWGFWHLGLSLGNQGRLVEAEAMFRRASEFNGTEQGQTALINLAGILFATGRQGEAEECLGVAAASTFSRPAAFAKLNLGTLLSHRDQLGAAAELLRAAVEQGDEELSAEALLELGLLFIRSQRYEDAIECFTTLAQTGSPDQKLRGLRETLVLRLVQGRSEEAAIVAHQIAEEYEGDTAAFAWCCIGLLAASEDDARAAFSRGIEVASQELAESLRTLGDKDEETIELLLASMFGDPSNELRASVMKMLKRSDPVKRGLGGRWRRR